MDDTTEFDEQIAGLEEEIGALNRQHSSLKKKRDDVLTQRFIEVHNIIVDDVQLLEDAQKKSKTRFDDIWQYRAWLDGSECTKRFAEWCGTLYFTSELLKGRADATTPVSITDLQEGGEATDD